MTTVIATVVLGAVTVVASSDSDEQSTAGGGLEPGFVLPAGAMSVRVPTVPADHARVQDVKGTPRLPKSALTHLDIPGTALLAYQTADAVMAQVDEPCDLSWALLAAIGRAESDHGRYAGAQLLPDGTSSKEIRGVALDGDGPLARVRDTDAGLLDGDKVWDRAVGPMQFLPSTWRVVAVDTDGDGVRSPDDIDDAALAAGVLLCSAPEDLDTVRGRRAAVYRYNPSDSYVASVLALERAYLASEFDTPGWLASTDLGGVMLAMPSAPGTSATEGPVTRPGGSKGGHTAEADPGRGGHGAAADRVPSDGPDAAGPLDTPGPADSPEPGSTGTTDPPASEEPDPGTTDPPATEGPAPGTTEPPATEEPGPFPLTGVLTVCGPDPILWCLGEQPLDVGDAEFLGGRASADFDADGELESRAAELGGLAGTEVTALVAPDTAPAFVVAINDLPNEGR